ncbi:MAG: xanthine dehydrogenase family protein subunit M [Deltaproteobacteria bacterium]|nr:xanthine dehydrogenase family protein subunit M [Deltaproteobacteria bacterium]
MTIPVFELLRPKTLAEASELLLKHGDDARLIAGGTTLVILMKQRTVYYPYLIDLQGISGLDHITADGEGLRIGAMATQRAVETSLLVRRSFPALADAFGKIGNVRVRTTATVGGNLAHADYRLDPPPVLLILGADLVLSSPKQTRTVPIKDFYRGLYETALEPGEILAEVRVPPAPEGSRTLYLKYSSLSANDWPCLGVAALLKGNAKRCDELRLGVGGLAEKPLLIEGLELARNETITDSLLDEIARLVDEQISPISDLRGSEWYKREMARVFVKRAICALAEEDPHL